MSLGEESRGHGSLDTRHYYSSNRGGLEHSGHRSKETKYSTSSNCGGSGRRSSLTIHSSSRNSKRYVDRGGSSSQDTSHSSSHIHLFLFIFSTTHTGKEINLKYVYLE